MNQRKRILEVLEIAREALLDLCHHSAFEDDAPEFNEGGVGYEALKAIRELQIEEENR